MSNSSFTLPAATPLASLEVHAELVMLDLKKHVTLTDDGIQHIINQVGRATRRNSFNVLLKVPGEMDHALETWKDRLLNSSVGERIRAVIIITESPLFGVRTQTYLGKCSACFSDAVDQQQLAHV
jgi:hypothetical protein